MVSVDDIFPMMTVALQTLLEMTSMRKHEELLAMGALHEFFEGMGRAMFVSHQWVSSHHPDPKLEQLHVLQEALRNLITGRCRVSLPPVIELSVGRLKCPSVADFANQPLFMWLDYFSVPQEASTEAHRKRELAISCIPSYVSRCFFFVILCPPVHIDGRMLTHSSWSQRGWCRLEKMAAHLRREDGCYITITTASSIALGWDANGLCAAPGTGQFSFQEDRSDVAQVILRMLWSKLQGLLASGMLPQFRFLLNLQRFYFRGMDLELLEGLVPDFRTEIDPWDDPDSFIVARFLHDNLFQKVTDRDSAGWSPMCYAVLTDRVSLVRALLKGRANVNDRIKKGKKEANLTKNLPILALATAYHCNEVVQFLLMEGANVNASCIMGGTALIWAGQSNNGPAIKVLLDGKADPQLKAFPSASPFRAACGWNSVSAMKEMLIHMKVSLRFCLHTALALHGDCETISCLVQAGADVNERLQIPMTSAWWPLMKVLHGAHHLSPSGVTYLAYHHYGATPLIFSILTGKLDTIPVLLAAGASLDITNNRGKSAAQFLQEQKVPVSLSEPGLIRVRSSSEDSNDTISV